MRAFELSSALTISVAGALLSACGGGSSVPIVTDNAIGASALKHHQTFSYTGSKQTFIVPAGVTRLTLVARGGEGGGEENPPSGGFPGLPGRVYAVIPVHPGDPLYVIAIAASASSGSYVAPTPFRFPTPTP